MGVSRWISAPSFAGLPFALDPGGLAPSALAAGALLVSGLAIVLVVLADPAISGLALLCRLVAPSLSAAVIRARRVWPASLALGVYALPSAPGIAVHSSPPGLHCCHW